MRKDFVLIIDTAKKNKDYILRVIEQMYNKQYFYFDKLSKSNIVAVYMNGVADDCFHEMFTELGIDLNHLNTYEFLRKYDLNLITSMLRITDFHSLSQFNIIPFKASDILICTDCGYALDINEEGSYFFKDSECICSICTETQQ